MAGELERLLIRLEADTTLLRREIDKADKAVEDHGKTVDRELDKADRKFKQTGASIGSELKKLAASYLGIQTVFKAFDAIGAAGSVGDMARAANLSTDAFQVLSFAVERAGGSQEEAAKASQKFALNMAELRTRTGELNSFLQDHLPNLASQLRATHDQQQAYEVLANAVQSLKSESDKTALATAAFGQAGSDLVDVLGKGAVGLRSASDEAHNLGVVLSDDVISTGADLKKQYADLSAVIETTWQRAVVGAAGYLKTLYDVLAASNEAARNSTFRGPASLMSRPNAAPVGNWSTEVKPEVGPWQTSVSRAAQGATKLETPIPNFETTIDYSQADALSALHRQMLEAQGQQLQSAKEAADQEIETYRRMFVEHKIDAEDYARARSEIETTLSAKIQAQYEEETAKARESFAEVEGLINSTFSSTFKTALEDGTFSASKFFKNILDGFAEIAMQALVLKPIMDSLFGGGSTGAMSSIASSLFGGFRANGGPVAAGVPYVVGERGPELFVPHTGGKVLPNGSGVGVNSVTNVYQIDARGADISVAERIERALQMSESRRRDPVAAVAGQARRFPTRGI